MSYPQDPPRQAPPPTVIAAPVQGNLGIQMPWLITPTAILLIIEVCFGIIAIACGAQGSTPHAGWFLFVAIVAFLTSITWFIIFFINVPDARPNVPWLKIHLIYNAVIVILYIIAFIVILALNGGNQAYIAAGVFGILLTICYGLSGYFTLQKLRA